MELAKKVRACFQARQSTALAPKDVLAELESQFGLKNGGNLRTRVQELEGYVFNAVGNGSNRRYILIDT